MCCLWVTVKTPSHMVSVLGEWNSTTYCRLYKWCGNVGWVTHTYVLPLAAVGGAVHTACLGRHSLLGYMHREMHAVVNEASAAFPAVGGFWLWSANFSGVSLISGNVFIFLNFASFDFYLVKRFFIWIFTFMVRIIFCWSQLWSLEKSLLFKNMLKHARSVVYESNTWGPPQV